MGIIYIINTCEIKAFLFHREIPVAAATAIRRENPACRILLQDSVLIQKTYVILKHLSYHRKS